MSSALVTLITSSATRSSQSLIGSHILPNIRAGRLVLHRCRGVGCRGGHDGFAPAGTRIAAPDAGGVRVASTFGACTAGAAWLLGLNFWGHRGAIACSVATLIAGSAAALALRRRSVVPCAPRHSRRTIVLSVVLAIWASPVVAGALLMAPGPFPARFFNVDTPFRLIHVRELLRGSAFPPASLSNAGLSSANHYGGPAASAAIGTVSGLPAHTALFGVTLPVAMLGLFSATLLMTRRIVREDSPTLRAAVLLLLLTTWLWPLPEFADALHRAFSTASVVPVRDFAAHVWRDTQSFNNLFEDATHLFGRTLFLLACMPLVAPSARTLWAGAYAVMLLGQVKTGHALIGGIALGVGEYPRGPTHSTVVARTTTAHGGSRDTRSHSARARRQSVLADIRTGMDGKALSRRRCAPSPLVGLDRRFSRGLLPHRRSRPPRLYARLRDVHRPHSSPPAASTCSSI